MRILQVIDQLNIGGAERVLVDLTNILHYQREKVEVLTLVRPGDLSKQLDQQIRVTNLARTNKFSILKLFRCHQICSQFDIIHIHQRYNYRYVALAKLCFRGDYKILLHDHGGPIDNPDKSLLGLAWFLKRNKWFIGVNHSILLFALNLGLKRTRCLLLPNIVIKKSQKSIANTLTTKNTKLVHVSNFREPKNHGFAVELISELRNHMNFEIDFIGKVFDKEYYETFKRKLDVLSLNDFVRIEQNLNDIQPVIHNYQIGLHTSYQETGPLVLIEYLAQQLPFLAFRTGEVATQISKVLPEFFLDHFDVSQWIDRIKMLISNRDTFYQRMIIAFDELYSSEVYYQKCMSTYKSMLDEK